MADLVLPNACEKLRATAKELLAAKRAGGDAMAGKITLGAMLMVDFKELNHELYVGLEEVKQKTQATKKALDQNNLQLQNMQYQKSHYLKEIKACKDFRSQYSDEQIGMLPLEDFMEQAPAEMRRAADGGEHDDHNLQLVRLSFELKQRQDLCAKLEELRSRKQALTETVSAKRKTLEGLGEQLSAFKKASLPLQDYLHLPVDIKAKQRHMATLLPPPLYVLYSQLVAVEEAFGEPIEVTIKGSPQEAEAFLQKQKSKNASHADDGLHKRAEDEMDEDEDGRRSKRAKTTTASDLYEAFPLTIELKLKSNDQEVLSTLTFEYLSHLHIACVACENDTDGNFLVNLFPDDDGCDTPNLTNKVLEPNFCFDKARASKPFRWANHLAGLDFLPAIPTLSCPESAEGSAVIEKGVHIYREQQRVRRVLAALRLRCEARTKLMVQISALERLEYPQAYLRSPFFDQLPVPKCSLRTWKELKQEELTEQDADDMPHSEPASTPLRQKSGLVRKSQAVEVGDGTEDGELPDVDEEGLLMSPLEATTPGSHRRRKLEIGTPLGQEKESLEGSGRDVEPLSEELFPEATSSEGTRRFRAVLRSGREKVELQALVEISADYPVRPPFFKLSLKRGAPPASLPSASVSGCGSLDNPVLGDSSSDPEAINDILAIQQEVNVRCPSVLPSEHQHEVLSFQMMCLMVCLDKHAEFEHWAGAPCDVKREGQCGMRVCRGRRRSKALVTTSLEGI